MAQFDRLTATIITNAASYKSQAACTAMLARLKREYSRSGSYGCQLHQYKEAMYAIQDRYLELSPPQMAYGI